MAQLQHNAAKTNNYNNLNYRSIVDIWLVRVNYCGQYWGEYGWPLTRKRREQKKTSNKSCSELNFIQKSQVGAYVYLPQEWSFGLSYFYIL